MKLFDLEDTGELVDVPITGKAHLWKGRTEQDVAVAVFVGLVAVVAPRGSIELSKEQHDTIGNYNAEIAPKKFEEIAEGIRSTMRFCNGPREALLVLAAVTAELLIEGRKDPSVDPIDAYVRMLRDCSELLGAQTAEKASEANDRPH